MRPAWRLLLLPAVGALASWRFDDAGGAYYDRGYAAGGRGRAAPRDEMVDAVNDLGLTLLAIHNEDNENNIAISPYGALSVLIALIEGLQGDAVYEILHSAHLPEDKSVIRIGLRDIHRHLKSYFIPQEGFLSGLFLNHDSVTLRNEYEEVLKFYGFSYGSTNDSSFSTTEGTVKEATTVIPSSSTNMQGRTQGDDLTTMPSSSPSTTTEITPATTMTTTPKPETITSQPTTTTTTNFPTTITPIITTSITVPSTSQQSTTESPATTTTAQTTTYTSQATTVSQMTTTTAATTTTVQTESTTTPTTTTTTTTSAPTTISTSAPETTSNPTTTEAIEKSTTTEPPLTTTIQTIATNAVETTTAVPETTPQETTLADTTSTENTRTARSVLESEMAALIQSTLTMIQTTTEDLGTTEKASFDMKTDQSTSLSSSTIASSLAPSISNNSSNNFERTTLFSEQILTTTITNNETTDFITENTLDYSYYTDPGTQTNPDIFDSPTTENDINANITTTGKRNVRSVIDYIIARAYDEQQPEHRHSYYIPQDPLTFSVYGKYREANINFMKYDTVLPFYYIPHLDTMALSFPLDSTNYYLLLLLPADEAGIDKLICDLRINGSLKYIVKNLKFAHVIATIPSFMLKGHVVLTQTFQKIGIRKVFEPRQADFSPMTSEPGIYVTNIEQAVTVTIRNYVEPEKRESFRSLHNYEPLHFKADHPFLYFVIDSELQATLMAGKVVNPLNSRIR